MATDYSVLPFGSMYMQIGISTEIFSLASKLLCILNCQSSFYREVGVVCRYVHFINTGCSMQSSR